MSEIVSDESLINEDSAEKSSSSGRTSLNGKNKIVFNDEVQKAIEQVSVPQMFHK